MYINDFKDYNDSFYIGIDKNLLILYMRGKGREGGGGREVGSE